MVSATLIGITGAPSNNQQVNGIVTLALLPPLAVMLMLGARFLSLRGALNSANVVSVVGVPTFETERSMLPLQRSSGDRGADSGAAVAVSGAEWEGLSNRACVLSALGIIAVAVLTLVIGFGSVVDPSLASGRTDRGGGRILEPHCKQTNSCWPSGGGYGGDLACFAEATVTNWQCTCTGSNYYGNGVLRTLAGQAPPSGEASIDALALSPYNYRPSSVGADLRKYWPWLPTIANLSLVCKDDAPYNCTNVTAVFLGDANSVWREIRIGVVQLASDWGRCQPDGGGRRGCTQGATTTECIALEPQMVAGRPFLAESTRNKALMADAMVATHGAEDWIGDDL